MILETDFFLLVLMLITLIITLIDQWVWKAQGYLSSHDIPIPKPFTVRWCRRLWPLFSLLFFVHAFVVQGFIMPSVSSLPTVKPNDFVLINRMSYGLKLPLWHKTLIHFHEPHRGDLVAFRWPLNSSLIYLKRIIGIPGDQIDYINKVLYINGKAVPQVTTTSLNHTHDSSGLQWNVVDKQEVMNGHTYTIHIRPDKPVENFYRLTIPKSHYFVMGDNRDDSDDSRYWGFVPSTHLIGTIWGK